MSGAKAIVPFVREQHARIFGRPWSVIPSAIVVAALNVFLFAFDRPWTASDGLRNWGDWLFQSIGLLHQPDLLSPLLYSGSLLNLGLLLGGSAAALLAREFGVRPAPPSELVKGAIGGTLMGCGAVLSFGCNIGGFFSAVAALSLSGVTMMAGLAIGAFVAARYVMPKPQTAAPAGGAAFLSPCEPPPQSPRPSDRLGFQPVIGSLLLFAIIAAASLYRQEGYAPQAMFLLFGAGFGIVLQRSRFCLVRAFREPFMTGESEHARAAALALIMSLIGFSILKATDLKDAGDWVFPSFWFGASLGGALFGIGMVIAGGCGAGSIWRAGEGHLKLWVAVFFFAVTASALRGFLTRTELIQRLGSAHFLPDLLGWGSAVSVIIVLMVLWYLLSAWNEDRKTTGSTRNPALFTHESRSS
jgi:uncharacterized membrane protein YedE/YeeE